MVSRAKVVSAAKSESGYSATPTFGTAASGAYAADATIQWTPTSDYRGLDSFSVGVQDASGAVTPLETVHVHRYESATLDYQITAPATAEAQLPYDVSARIANNGNEDASRTEVALTIPDSFALATGSAALWPPATLSTCWPR